MMINSVGFIDYLSSQTIVFFSYYSILGFKCIRKFYTLFGENVIIGDKRIMADRNYLIKVMEEKLWNG